MTANVGEHRPTTAKHLAGKSKIGRTSLPYGRLAQGKSACFTRKKSQVQILHRPP
jgi:hypothetical protein